MDDTKLNLADLNSPGREPFVRSLGFFVALAVPWQINFSCASTGGAKYTKTSATAFQISVGGAGLIHVLKHTVTRVYSVDSYF